MNCNSPSGKPPLRNYQWEEPDGHCILNMASHTTSKQKLRVPWYPWKPSVWNKKGTALHLFTNFPDISIRVNSIVHVRVARWRTSQRWLHFLKDFKLFSPLNSSPQTVQIRAGCKSYHLLIALAKVRQRCTYLQNEIRVRGHICISRIAFPRGMM